MLRRIASGLLIALGVVTTSPAQGVASDATADRGTTDEDSRSHHQLRLGFFNASLGYAAADLTTFVVQDDGEIFTPELSPSKLQGPAARLAAGLRLSAVTLSVVGNVAAFSADSRIEVDSLYLWSVDGELGFHLLSGFRIEPYLVLGGGYTSLNGIDDDVPGVDGATRVRGFNARGGIGVDYYPSDTVSIGLLGTAELLFLTRPGVSALGLMKPEQVETVGDAKDRALEGSGTSVGTAYSIVLGPGLHF